MKHLFKSLSILFIITSACSSSLARAASAEEAPEPEVARYIGDYIEQRCGQDSLEPWIENVARRDVYERVPEHVEMMRGDANFRAFLECVHTSVEKRRLTLERAQQLLLISLETRTSAPDHRRRWRAMSEVLSALRRNFWTYADVLPGLLPRIETLARREGTQGRDLVSRIRAIQALLKDESFDFPTQRVARDGGSRERLIIREAPTGIIRVGSTYRNRSSSLATAASQDQNGTPYPVAGTGNLTSADWIDPTYQYVLTAAHVIAGSNPWVEIDGRRVTIEAKVIDSEADVAVLKIRKTTSPPALVSFDDQTDIRISPEYADDYDSRRIGEAQIGYTQESYVRILSDGRQVPAREIMSLSLSMPLTPWVPEGRGGSGLRSGTEDSMQRWIGLSWNAQQIRARTTLMPGTSGTMIYHRARFDETYDLFKGIVTQSNYYFSETYFASSESVMRLMRMMKNGFNGNVNQTRWQMRNGLTYRVFESGWEEASFVQRPTSAGIHSAQQGIASPRGRGVVGDPGRGVVGDPGRGVVGDPGRGVIGDPGRGLVGDPGRGAVGDTGSSEQATAQSPWDKMSPREVFSHFGLRPGMVYRGQPIVAVRASTTNANIAYGQSLILYPDWMSLEFMREQSAAYEFTPIAYGTSLIELAHQRVGLSSAPTRVFEAISGPTRTFWAPPEGRREVYRQPGRSTIVMTRSGIEVRVEAISRIDGRQHFLIHDQLEFSLDENGKLLGQSEFLPIIEVRGKVSGEIYYVDIRKLFFDDLSQVSLPFQVSDMPPIDRVAEVRRQLRTFGFTARNSVSGIGHRYIFDETVR